MENTRLFETAVVALYRANNVLADIANGDDETPMAGTERASIGRLYTLAHGLIRQVQELHADGLIPGVKLHTEE